MYQCRNKPIRRRPRRAEFPLDDAARIEAPAEPRELYTLTLHNPRTGRDCVIAPFPGTRPGNLRVMINGAHEPKLGTTTELMAWLRAKLPRTSPKRAMEE